MNLRCSVVFWRARLGGTLEEEGKYDRLDAAAEIWKQKGKGKGKERRYGCRAGHRQAHDKTCTAKQADRRSMSSHFSRDIWP